METLQVPAIDHNQTTTKKKAITFLAHVGIWFFLFLFPALLGDRFDMGNGFLRLQLIILACTAGLFYLNYFLFIPRYFLLKKYIAFVAINLITVVALMLIINFIEQAYIPHPRMNFPPPHLDKPEFTPPKKMKPPVDLKWYRNLLMLLVTVGAAVAVKVSGKWLEEENKRKIVETEHLKSEMSLLRFQLQPHFFFNTLNNIYSLIAKDPAQAQEVVHQLSKLMRHVIYKADKPQIPIEEEISFLKAYIAVSEKRLGAHAKVIASFPEEELQGSIPPLLFISIIENAFKHGIDASQESFIHISLSVNSNHLRLEVSNSYFPKSREDQSGSGIGVSNLRRRLELLYHKDEFSLNQSCKNDVYTTELTLFKLYEQN